MPLPTTAAVGVSRIIFTHYVVLQVKQMSIHTPHLHLHDISEFCLLKINFVVIVLLEQLYFLLWRNLQHSKYR